MVAAGLEIVAIAVVGVLALTALWLFRRRQASASVPSGSETPAAPGTRVSGSAGRDPTEASPTAATIFLSYASADRSTAEAIAGALSTLGWSVWWDRTIPPGRSFDEVIEAALDSARCVIVLWSRESVSSDWVKTEAAEGARRRILVPALIEEVTIPLEFRRIQAASLVGWTASSPHTGFDALVQSVAALVRPHQVRPDLG